MAALRIMLVVAAAWSACARAESVTARRDDVTLALEPRDTGGFQLTLFRGTEQVFSNRIGRSVESSAFVAAQRSSGAAAALQLREVSLSVEPLAGASGAAGVRVRWAAGDNRTRFQDCYDFGTKHWYGGPMMMNQVYPIEKATLVNLPYVTREADNGAVMERYWLNSAGEYIYVNPQVPLFVDYNSNSTKQICFTAQVAAPYSAKRTHTELSYDVWILADVKRAHQHAVINYLGKPSGVPDYKMIQYPIWSTWAQFERNIDEKNLIEFAQNITAHGFKNSQLEIDDLWEICYGSLTVDTRKFSDFGDLVKRIKALGYRVTLWIHPFINKGCEPWYTNALNSGYLVLNENGSPDTSWWNNNGTVAAYVDFTNPAAKEWWYERVKYVLDTYDIDSLKFDAGESSWGAQVPVQTGAAELHPHHIVQEYVKTCARFGNMIEVRTGFRTQELPIFVRMVDRDSVWGTTNGLTTIITTTFQMNLNGYTLVLPDMIGGNGFNLGNEWSALPTKELYIRWVQANTFLPAMQFSFVPWRFDEETTEISLKYTELHARYADKVVEAMQASTRDGSPVVAPLWWLDPADQQALAVDDQYLLGSDVLVAPVLAAGAESRDVYLPAGSWLAQGEAGRVLAGPGWLRDYAAPLDVLPYFVRAGAVPPDQPGAAAAPRLSVLLLSGALFTILYGLFV